MKIFIFQEDFSTICITDLLVGLLFENADKEVGGTY